MTFFLSSRKGFEMAIGTLVVMILGIVIIAGGIILLRQLTASGEGAVAELNTNQVAELNKLLTKGQLVATFPSHQEVAAGKTVVFGVAVANKLDTKTFMLKTQVFNNLSADITTQMTGPQLTLQVTNISSLKVQKNGEADAALAVTPAKGAPAGVYTIVVTVLDGTVVYDTPRFFTVRVR
jgi:uncharacterized membrane protein